MTGEGEIAAPANPRQIHRDSPALALADGTLSTNK